MGLLKFGLCVVTLILCDTTTSKDTDFNSLLSKEQECKEGDDILQTDPCKRCICVNNDHRIICTLEDCELRTFQNTSNLVTGTNSINETVRPPEDIESDQNQTKLRSEFEDLQSELPDKKTRLLSLDLNDKDRTSLTNSQEINSDITSYEDDQNKIESDSNELDTSTYLAKLREENVLKTLLTPDHDSNDNLVPESSNEIFKDDYIAKSLLLDDYSSELDHGQDRSLLLRKNNKQTNLLSNNNSKLSSVLALNKNGQLRSVPLARQPAFGRPGDKRLWMRPRHYMRNRDQEIPLSKLFDRNFHSWYSSNPPFGNNQLENTNTPILWKQLLDKLTGYTQVVDDHTSHAIIDFEKSTNGNIDKNQLFNEHKYQPVFIKDPKPTNNDLLAKQFQMTTINNYPGLSKVDKNPILALNGEKNVYIIPEDLKFAYYNKQPSTNYPAITDDKNIIENIMEIAVTDFYNKHRNKQRYEISDLLNDQYITPSGVRENTDCKIPQSIYDNQISQRLSVNSPVSRHRNLKSNLKPTRSLGYPYLNKLRLNQHLLSATSATREKVNGNETETGPIVKEGWVSVKNSYDPDSTEYDEKPSLNSSLSHEQLLNKAINDNIKRYHNIQPARNSGWNQAPISDQISENYQLSDINNQFNNDNYQPVLNYNQQQYPNDFQFYFNQPWNDPLDKSNDYINPIPNSNHQQPSDFNHQSNLNMNLQLPIDAQMKNLPWNSQWDNNIVNSQPSGINNLELTKGINSNNDHLINVISGDIHTNPLDNNKNSLNLLSFQNRGAQITENNYYNPDKSHHKIIEKFEIVDAPIYSKHSSHSMTAENPLSHPEVLEFSKKNTVSPKLEQNMDSNDSLTGSKQLIKNYESKLLEHIFEHEPIPIKLSAIQTEKTSSNDHNIVLPRPHFNSHDIKPYLNQKVSSLKLNNYPDNRLEKIIAKVFNKPEIKQIKSPYPKKLLFDLGELSTLEIPSDNDQTTNILIQISPSKMLSKNEFKNAKSNNILHDVDNPLLNIINYNINKEVTNKLLSKIVNQNMSTQSLYQTNLNPLHQPANFPINLSNHNKNSKYTEDHEDTPLLLQNILGKLSASQPSSSHFYSTSGPVLYSSFPKSDLINDNNVDNMYVGKASQSLTKFKPITFSKNIWSLIDQSVPVVNRHEILNKIQSINEHHKNPVPQDDSSSFQTFESTENLILPTLNIRHPVENNDDKVYQTTSKPRHRQYIYKNPKFKNNPNYPPIVATNTNRVVNIKVYKPQLSPDAKPVLSDEFNLIPVGTPKSKQNVIQSHQSKVTETKPPIGKPNPLHPLQNYIQTYLNNRFIFNYHKMRLLQTLFYLNQALAQSPGHKVQKNLCMLCELIPCHYYKDNIPVEVVLKLLIYSILNSQDKYALLQSQTTNQNKLNVLSSIINDFISQKVMTPEFNKPNHFYDYMSNKHMLNPLTINKYNLQLTRPVPQNMGIVVPQHWGELNPKPPNKPNDKLLEQLHDIISTLPTPPDNYDSYMPNNKENSIEHSRLIPFLSGYHTKQKYLDENNKEISDTYNSKGMLNPIATDSSKTQEENQGKISFSESLNPNQNNGLSSKDTISNLDYKPPVGVSKPQESNLFSLEHKTMSQSDSKYVSSNEIKYSNSNFFNQNIDDTQSAEPTSSNTPAVDFYGQEVNQNEFSNVDTSNNEQLKPEKIVASISETNSFESFGQNAQSDESSQQTEATSNIDPNIGNSDAIMTENMNQQEPVYTRGQHIGVNVPLVDFDDGYSFFRQSKGC